jgi:nitroreductase
MTTRRNLVLGGGAVAVAGAVATYAAYRGMGSLQDYEAAVATTRAALRQTPQIREFVRFATLAASGHNTQPWRFRLGAHRIDILPDFARRTPVVDPEDHHLFASLGCAAENLALAAAARGQPGELHFDPSHDGAVAFDFSNGPASGSALFEAIPKRQSSRTEYDGKPVSNADQQTLADAATIPGVDLFLITDRMQINRIRDLVIAGNTAQIGDRAFMDELKTWLRFAPRDAVARGDGLFSASSGSPILPAWLGPRIFEWVFKAAAENDKYARQIASSPGIAVFAAQKADREHWVLAGRACQRFALQATALGMKCAFINQPVEVARLRPELATLIGVPGRRPDLVLRYGYGPSLPYSARRPVEETILLDQLAAR